MILSDKDIIENINRGEIIVEPFNIDNIQPASLDLHLGKDFLVFKKEAGVIDPKLRIDEMMERFEIDEDGYFIIEPNGFALGIIDEVVGVSSSLVGRLEGKSSIGRMGLLIHVTAGFLDPGNKLKMTLELHNTSPLPIKLYYKMPIAQMAFEKLSSECDNPYCYSRGNKYVDDMIPIASQMWQNFNENKWK